MFLNENVRKNIIDCFSEIYGELSHYGIPLRSDSENVSLIFTL